MKQQHPGRTVPRCDGRQVAHTLSFGGRRRSLAELLPEGEPLFIYRDGAGRDKDGAGSYGGRLYATTEYLRRAQTQFRAAGEQKDTDTQMREVMNRVDAAWSAADPPPPVPYRHSWRTACRDAGLLLCSGLAAAGAVLVLTGARPVPSAPPGTGGSGAAAPTLAVEPQPAPFVVPTVTAGALSQDDRFVALVGRHGVKPKTRAGARLDATEICANLARLGLPGTYAGYERSTPQWDKGQVDAYVDAAVGVYCPELGPT